jgi:hypothetical protein
MRCFWRRSSFALPSSVAHELFSTTTSSDGRFRIDGFPANGMASLSARSPGRAYGEPRRFDIGPDSAFRPGKDIGLQVEPASRVEGRIVMAAKGEPVFGAIISLRT